MNRKIITTLGGILFFALNVQAMAQQSAVAVIVVVALGVPIYELSRRRSLTHV